MESVFIEKPLQIERILSPSIKEVILAILKFGIAVVFEASDQRVHILPVEILLAELLIEMAIYD